MKRFYEYAGAVALVVLTWAVLMWLLVLSLPLPTPEEQAAFDRWQVEQMNRVGATGGEKKE
ncbi:hypothetical protein [Thiobacillus sp.]|uniref:hypothetical protein n=1 Tax=Thiobacillus sp. TaxID=924 RepID=UPI0025CC7433|nr:hypothetical protein [Thiobacillus sp.]